MQSERLDLAERMGLAARDLQDGTDPQATMETAVRLAVLNVRGCDAATISLVEGQGRIETPAYTDDDARGADVLQSTLGEGPCLDAAWEERVVHSADLAADPRWPVWGARVAADHGVRSVLSVQLFTHADRLGALNLYARTTAAFDAEDRDDGLALAAHVAVAVAAARTADQLARALDSRTLVGQAVGIVMERYRLDPGAAFSVLARVSSETNTKVRDIAAELVATGHLHGTDRSPAPAAD
ncbi:GAF and ANTAR domain-containing protein [Nocardioides sp.]|uniref:GAF and ANTAR domain-containing protein n=1 Tax=Nocardioides sp. TaxID=35761 RepID=UPI002EDA66E3